MKLSRRGIAPLLCLAFLGAHMGLVKGPASIQSKPLAHPPDQLKINESYGKLSLAFEINEGQIDPQVRFLCRGGGYTLFLTPAEAVLALKNMAKSEKVNKGERLQPQLLTPNSSFLTGTSDVVRLRLIGGNRLCRVEGLEKLPGVSNYFTGNDPSKWRTNVAQYAKVKLKDVYPGIDMVYYGAQGNPFDGAQGGGRGRLEYDFVVKPGADPKAIALKVDGAEKVRVDGKGNLRLTTRGREVMFRAPVIYQSTGKDRKPVDGRYSLAGNKEVGFEVADYDRSHPLVIDPVLDYSTYLGGTISEGGSGIAVDSSGNAYVVGATNSANFPTTAGAYQTASVGGTNYHSFVAKLNPDGTALVYSTYLGGNGIESGFGIAVDSSGNATVTGYTLSTNFPTTAGAFQTSKSGGFGADTFVTKLNPAGTALVYSTYLGGNGDDEGSGIAVDSSGNAYVTGYTLSTNFPTTAGAFQTASVGGTNYHSFVAKLNPDGTALVYSTYLGGNSEDRGQGIAVDSSGNAYVIGRTQSTNFPITVGAFQTTYGGSWDAFVTKLNATGTGLLYSTYLGGNSEDRGQGIAVDSGGNAYATGFTLSNNFPTTPGAYQTIQSGGSDAFVTELSADGSALLYSTYLGETGGDSGQAIAVDSDGNAYVVGVTWSTNFPTTPGAYQTILGGEWDVFVIKLNPTGTTLIYSTYLGGKWSDVGHDIAVDAGGNAYVTGGTDSTDFPTTTGAYQIASGGGNDAFVAKFGFVTPTPTFAVLPDCESLSVSHNRFKPSDGPVTLVAQPDCLTKTDSLKVYNTVGENVKNIVLPDPLPVGPVTLTWDGTNQGGEKCASGMYVFRLASPRGLRHARVLLIR